MRLVVVNAVYAPHACGNLPKVALALGALPALSSQRRGHPRCIDVVRNVVGESLVSGTVARDALCDLCLRCSNTPVLYLDYVQGAAATHRRTHPSVVGHVVVKLMDVDPVA